MRRKTKLRRGARGAMELFERGLRIAVLSRHKGRWIVSDLVEADFPTTPAGQTLTASAKAAAIRDALRSRGWRLRGMVLVLPKNVVTMRLVTLPSTDDAELSEMARFEAQKHIPFNVERHIIAHAVLRKEGVQGSRVLIVAVDRAALDEPLAICQELRIDVVYASVSSLALVEALLLNPPTDYQKQTFALVNIGWSTVDITIVSGGIVCLTRSGTMGIGRIAPILEEATPDKAPVTRDRLGALDALAPENFFRGGPRLHRRRPMSIVVDDFGEMDRGEISLATATVGERGGGEKTVASSSADLSGPAGEVARWLERIVQEIRRTQAFAQREFDCPQLEMVYLAGAGSYIGGIEKYLGQHLSCPVAVISPPPTLEFAETKTADLRQAWAEFAITIGAGAGSALPAVSLLPPEYVEGLRLRRKRRSLAVTGILVLLLIALGTAYALRWAGDKRHTLGFYEEHNRTLEPEVRRLRDKEKRYEIIQRVVKDPYRAGVVLEAICQSPPVTGGQVRLISYHYTQGEEVVLEGHALTATDVDLLKAELEKSKFFAEVLVENRQRTNLPPDRPKTDVYSYKIRCRFSQSPAR